MSVPKALTIAGSDSGGGAGIQADLKTFSAFGVFGMSALTAVTAQNTVGVAAVFALAPDLVARQIDAVLDDAGADAVKIGMLATAATVTAVAERLRAHRQERIVLDPVLVASSGARLLEDAARTPLVKELLPLADVVTPNLDEAAALAGMAVATEGEMAEAARRIHALGARHVLVTGGHLPDQPTDILWDGRTLTRFPGPRISGGPGPHGTGCTFSAALAAGFARGRPLVAAIRDAKAYVAAAIRAGFAVGRGAGVLRHFVTAW